MPAPSPIRFLRKILREQKEATAAFLAGRFSEPQWQGVIHMGECAFQGALPAATLEELRTLQRDPRLGSGMCDALLRQEIAERQLADRAAVETVSRQCAEHGGVEYVPEPEGE